MIFPDLPRPYRQRVLPYTSNAPNAHNLTDCVETPLRGVEDTDAQSQIDIERWFAAHGLPNTAQDPAALSRQRTANEPIDWWARDALEFYALCLGFAAWIVLWYGLHSGAWTWHTIMAVFGQ